MAPPMATVGKRPNDAGGDEEPAARRQRTLKVIDPDFTVIVEGTRVPVNSIFLRIHSPVFDAMISSEMREGLSREVNLEGKSADEFYLFYQYLQGCRQLTVEDAFVLCSWADEYQVDLLKEACDDVLTNDPKITPKRLVLANKFHLPKLFARCKDHFLQSEAHLFRLKKLVEMQDGAAALAELWPEIYEKTTGIQCECPPSAESVKYMWPIVEKLLEANDLAEVRWAEALNCEEELSELKSTIRSTISLWPSCLPVVHNKAWLELQVQGLLRRM